MSAALQLLERRRQLARLVAAQIGALHLLDFELLLEMQSEPRERQNAIVTAMGEDDDLMIKALTSTDMESEVGK